MKIKLFELRDSATFISIFAFRARPSDGSDVERYLLARAGYGPAGNSDCVIMGRLDCPDVNRNATYSPFAWNDRTFTTAHRYIWENFDRPESGSVIDVEFILKETTTPKESERFTYR